MKYLTAMLVALATVVTAFGQDTSSVGPYPLGKSAVNVVPTPSIASFLDKLELAKGNDSLFLHLEGKYDSVRVTNSNMNNPFNYLIGEFRAVALRELAIHAGFPKARIVTERAKLGKIREVEYWFSKGHPVKSTAVNDSIREYRQDSTAIALQAQIDSTEARRVRDSIAIANKPSTLSSIIASLTVGGGVMGRSVGPETPRGINGGFFFQDSKGVSQEFGYMGLGSYNGQGGSTIYSLTSFRISGDEESGIDFTVALGHSWYQRDDKFDKVAPFRTIQLPFAGAGITGYTKVWVVPVRATLTANYQPEVYVYDGNFEFHEHAMSIWLKVSFRPLAFLGE